MRTLVVCLLTLVLFAHPRDLRAYAVLTHEAIIDSAWDHSISPLIRKRFPQVTPEELKEAHACAYGGCIIQDMGYYPFGSKFFSDLVHYVRSGDFVGALIAESRDPKEYAFALGALAHYCADNDGHPLAVNPAVGLAYPKLRARYGPKVTYEENPAAHLKTEFGFDVLQVAAGRYAPKAYHDFIGFEVSKDLLERACRKTYGLELKDIFASVDLALGTYRRTVSTILPEATKVAWELKKDELQKAQPGLTRARFVYNLSRADYEKDWGAGYQKPGIGAKILAFFFRIIPKFGPFRGIEFKPPTPVTEKMFMASFNATLDSYRKFLGEAGSGTLSLANRDFDTGKPTRAGEYKLADQTYSELLRKLAKANFDDAGPELRANILVFYSDLSAPIATKRHKKQWRETLEALAQLKARCATQSNGGR